ncbi:MAG TPA: tetratricopeptide repeat protein, partial [bacterium]|nr:tetratricopeptide repeat protein [bacterium]
TVENKILLAQCYAQAEQYSEAVPLLTAAAAARPDDTALAMLLQRCQLSAERAAGEELKKKGDTALAAGRPGEAADFYRQAAATKNPPDGIAQLVSKAERLVLLQDANELLKQVSTGGDAGEAAEVLARLKAYQQENNGQLDSELAEKQSQLLLLRARQMVSNGDYPAAQEDLGDLALLIEKDATVLQAAERCEVWFLLAQVNEKNGNYEQALRYYQKVKFSEPAYPEIDDRIEGVRSRMNLWVHIAVWLIIVTLGLALFFTRRRWQPALKRWWLTRLGDQAFVAGDWGEARRQYEAVQAMPDPPAAVLTRLTEVYQKLRMTDDAAQTAAQASAGGGRDWSTSAVLLQQQLANRDFPAAQAQLAELTRLAVTDQLRQELKRLRLQVAEACGAWSEAAKAHAELDHPVSDATHQRRQIELWIKAGAIDQATEALQDYRQRQSADWEWVADRLQELRRRFPESLRLAMALGELYEAQGEAPAAIGCYADVLARVPQKEPLLRRLLVLYEQERDWEAVVATGTELLARVAAEPGVCLALARAQQHRHDYAAAADFYLRALALEQDNVEAYHQLVEIGRYYAGREEHAPAVALFRRLMELTLFDRVEVRFELGRSLYALGEYDAAITELQQVKRGASIMRWQARNITALCLLAKGMADLALAQLDEIPVETAGFDAALRLMVLYNRGLVQEQRGDVAAAVAEYRKVVLVELNFRDAAQRLERLTAAGS